jgi:hypothetical protein
MQEYQQRVVQEKANLDEKIAKLNAFLGQDGFPARVPDEAERSRLTSQFSVMSEYSRILGERIANFPK